MQNLQKFSFFKTQNLIGSEWVGSSDSETVPVCNPANNELIAEVPAVTAQQVEQAVESAAEAFKSWRQKPAKERADILGEWARLMQTHAEGLATIMTLEQGKPFKESLGEVVYSANYIQWFAGEAERLYGDVIPAAQAQQNIWVYKEPVGVCAFITPWNFPIAMLARKAGAALACGCTVVAKPASATPLSALAFAALGREAGLPGGVINIVTGASSTIGQVFTGHPLVKKISFTGSTEVGQKLYSRGAEHFKKVSLELGGNAPLIVFDDADQDKAIQGLIAAKYRNNGQTCVCVNRLFVQRSIYDEFVQKLECAVAALKPGDAFAEDTDITVLINQAAVEKFNAHIRDALEHGGELLLGGESKDSGCAVKPTLIKNGQPDMLHCQEETFAPLLVAIPFDDEEQVLEWANDTPYGLASYFYSRDISRVLRVSAALQSGMVGANETAISNVAAPFGGVKHSGMGREGSKYGMDDYVQTKYVLAS